MFKNTAFRSNLAAFAKINIAVSMIFSDISRHAQNRNIGFMVTHSFSFLIDTICVNIYVYDI